MGCCYSRKKFDVSDSGLEPGLETVTGTHVNAFDVDSSYRLSEEQCALVKKTWTIIKTDSTMNGLQVFLLFFEKEPSAKKLFGIENVPLKQVPKNATILMHIPRFMEALDKAVGYLEESDDAMNNFDTVLIDIGRRHQHHKSFKASYFDKLCESLMIRWKRRIGTEFTEEVKLAWSHVFGRIMTKLKEGYEDKQSLDRCDNQSMIKYRLVKLVNLLGCISKQEMGCDSSKSTANPELKSVLDKEPGTAIKTFKSGTSSELTKEECAIVKKTWSIIKSDSKMNGLQVFLLFFERAPDARKLFGIENVPLKDIPKNATMLMHIPRFMEALDKAVEQLQEDADFMEQFDAVLIDIGRRHKQYNAFRVSYFDKFNESLISQWERIIGSEFTEDVRKAWGHVFGYLMIKLKEGYAIAQ